MNPIPNRPSYPVSPRAWNILFSVAMAGWAVLFGYGAVITHIA